MPSSIPPTYVLHWDLSQTLTLRAAFASSTYLLSQIPGPACLNPPNPLFKGAHQAFVRTRAHGHRFAVLRPASDDALLYDLFGAEEEQDKAQEHKQQVERLGTEIFFVKDDGAENEGNEDAAAPYH